jgi:hypothetical protein
VLTASYAYLSSAQNVPYGPAQQVQNGDNSTPYAETGMFQLSGTGLRQLVPVWVNNDKSVVPNQQFGLDSSNSLIMYGESRFPSAVVSALGGSLADVYRLSDCGQRCLRYYHPCRKFLFSSLMEEPS